MAKKTIHVNIPEPCHEDWSKMTATQCGAFCKACSKEVIDFTNKSEAQIVEILSQAKGKMCGRFTEDKLNKPLTKYEPDPEWYSWKKWAIAAGVLLGVGSISANWADTNPVAIILDNNTMRTMGEPAIAQVTDTAKVISDSTYNGLLVADTSVAVTTTCTRLVNPVGIDTTMVLMGDTIIYEEDTAIVQPPMPEIMGLVAPVIMGKMIATPQKDVKPKKGE
jgi:hypothetical protein